MAVTGEGGGRAGGTTADRFMLPAGLGLALGFGGGGGGGGGGGVASERARVCGEY